MNEAAPRLAAALLAGALWTGTADAQSARPGRAVAAPVAAPAGIETVRLRDDVYLLTGAGANIVVQVGPQGAVVVDSGDGARSDAVLAAIRALTPDPIRYVINTGAEGGFGGNLVLARAGRAFGQSLGGPNAKPGIAVVMATGGTAMRLEQGNDESDGWATQTIERRGAFHVNSQGIEVIAKPAAHNGGDAVVLFRASDVLVAGDLFDITRFPFIDAANGGTIEGELAALNDLIELAIPNVPLTWLEGGTLIVPSHGRVAHQSELVLYRDMVAIIRDRVKDLKDKGRTLKQVLEADPAAGYRERYGAETGKWTTATFLEAVYKTLPAAAEQAK